MRRDNDVLLSNQSMGASFNSPAIVLEHIQMAAIQLVWTGAAPTGEFKIQGSCTPVQNNGVAQDWSDIAGSSINITAAGDALINITDIGYDQMRVVYTRVSGTGTVNARFVVKGF